MYVPDTKNKITSCKLCFQDLLDTQKYARLCCQNKCSLEVHYSCWVDRKRVSTNWMQCVTLDCESQLVRCVFVDQEKNTELSLAKPVQVPLTRSTEPTRVSQSLSAPVIFNNNNTPLRVKATHTPPKKIEKVTSHQVATTTTSDQITLVPHAKDRDNWIRSNQKLGIVVGYHNTFVCVCVCVRLEGQEQKIIECQLESIVGNYPRMGDIVNCMFESSTVKISVV